MTKENSLFPFGQIFILELINYKGFIQDKSIIRPLFMQAFQYSFTFIM